MTTVITVALITAAALAAWFFFFRKTSPSAQLSPLPESREFFPRIFQAWNGMDESNNEANIAMHDLYWHTPEAYGVLWYGDRPFTAPSFAGLLSVSTIRAGLEKRARLKALNPEIKLLVQIGYTEGDPATTDFPDGHPWWLRDSSGNKVKGWGSSYLFNLDLPEVRRHVADCAREAMATGIWDGIMLDVWYDDNNHLDILRKVRSVAPIVICNTNYKLCPLTIGLMDGTFMECGPLVTKDQWRLAQEALDFNERHVRHPALNCLELSGARLDFRAMRAATCLSLTRSNGYALYADPGEAGVASTHFHAWFNFWNADLGYPTGPTMSSGTLGSRREFQNGTAVFNPMGGSNILLTFAEPRIDASSGSLSSSFTLPPNDGGIYLKTA